MDQKKVLFTTVNQWFDESIFYENTVKNYIIHQLTIKNLKNIKIIILKDLKIILMK